MKMTKNYYISKLYFIPYEEILYIARFDGYDGSDFFCDIHFKYFERYITLYGDEARDFLKKYDEYRGKL